MFYCALAIEVFSCCNVELITHEPPAIVNAKRERKGKVPFFSFQTLHITGEAHLSKPLGGKHESPRLHLRRGHIRRLADRKIWVRECLVGDKSKGFAAHDYKTHTGEY